MPSKYGDVQYPTEETHDFAMHDGTLYCWRKGLTEFEAHVRVAMVFIEANLAREEMNGTVTKGKAAGDAEAQGQPGEGNGSGDTGDIGNSDRDGRAQRGQVSRAHRGHL